MLKLNDKLKGKTDYSITLSTCTLFVEAKQYNSVLYKHEFQAIGYLLAAHPKDQIILTNLQDVFWYYKEGNDVIKTRYKFGKIKFTEEDTCTFDCAKRVNFITRLFEQKNSSGDELVTSSNSKQRKPEKN